MCRHKDENIYADYILCKLLCTKLPVSKQKLVNSVIYLCRAKVRELNNMWLIVAKFSSFFAGATSVLAKCDIRKSDSDVATAIRTVVALIMEWIIVVAKGKLSQLKQTDKKIFLKN